MSKVKLNICGREYNIQTAEETNYVYRLSKKLESKIMDLVNQLKVSQYEAAVMTALSTMDDLNKTQEQVEELLSQMKDSADEIGRIRLERDTALKEIDALQSKINRLEAVLKQKRLNNQNQNGNS